MKIFKKIGLFSKMDGFKKVGFAPRKSHHVLLSGDSVVFDLGKGRFQVRDRFSGELQQELQYSGNDKPREVIALGPLGWAVRGIEVLDVYARGKGGRIEQNSYPTCVDGIDGALYIPATGIILAYEWVDTYSRGNVNRLSFIAPETAQCFHQLKVPEGNLSSVTEVRTDGSLVLLCGEESSELDEKGYGIEKFKATNNMNWTFIDGTSLSFEDAREKLKYDEHIVVGYPGGEIIGYTIEGGVLRVCQYDGPEYPPIELTTGVKPVGAVRLFNGHFLISVTPDPALLKIDLVKGEIERTDLPEELEIYGWYGQDRLLSLKNDEGQVHFFDANTDSLKPTPISTSGRPRFHHLNRNTVIAQDRDGAETVRLIDVGNDDIQVEELPGSKGIHNIISDGDDDLWLALDGVSYRCSIRELKEHCFGS